MGKSFRKFCLGQNDWNCMNRGKSAFLGEKNSVEIFFPGSLNDLRHRQWGRFAMPQKCVNYKNNRKGLSDCGPCLTAPWNFTYDFELALRNSGSSFLQIQSMRLKFCKYTEMNCGPINLFIFGAKVRDYTHTLVWLVLVSYNKTLNIIKKLTSYLTDILADMNSDMQEQVSSVLRFWS